MKVLINEQDIINMVKRVIKEYHKGQQLILPFDGSSEPYNYMQFIEYLESIGHYGKINPPTKTFEHCINNPELLENCGLYLLCDIYEQLDEYRTQELVKDLVKEHGYDIFTDDILEIISEYENPEDALYDSQVFNYCNMEVDELFSLFRDPMVLGQKLMDNGRAELEWLHNSEFKTNELGQIYIERVIDIPNPIDRFHEKGYTKEDEVLDYFQFISKHYEKIGNCWTYIDGAGDCYNTNLTNGTKINLKGWVNPEDVDWETTILLEQMDEYEIRLYSDIPVQIDEIEIIEGNFNGKKLPIKGSIIINT